MEVEAGRSQQNFLRTLFSIVSSLTARSVSDDPLARLPSRSDERQEGGRGRFSQDPIRRSSSQSFFVECSKGKLTSLDV
jgi:hypothetical protein